MAINLTEINKIKKSESYKYMIRMKYNKKEDVFSLTEENHPTQQTAKAE